MEREIFKTLVVSTGHMTIDDKDLLEENINRSESLGNADPVIVYSTGEYGFMVYINLDENEPPVEEEMDAVGADYSKAFRKLIGIARDLGCRYLNLDCDGPEYDDLEKFDW